MNPVDASLARFLRRLLAVRSAYLRTVDSIASAHATVCRLAALSYEAMVAQLGPEQREIAKRVAADYERDSAIAKRVAEQARDCN